MWILRVSSFLAPCSLRECDKCIMAIKYLWLFFLTCSYTLYHIFLYPFFLSTKTLCIFLGLPSVCCLHCIFSDGSWNHNWAVLCCSLMYRAIIFHLQSNTGCFCDGKYLISIYFVTTRFIMTESWRVTVFLMFAKARGSKASCFSNSQCSHVGLWPLHQAWIASVVRKSLITEFMYGSGGVINCTNFLIAFFFFLYN